MFNSKVFVAEFIGTFAYVFIGAAAGVYGQSLGLLGIALAHGLTLAVFVYAFGHISGTHINPAVTLGLAVNGTIKWVEAILYWVAQFSAAFVAAFLLRTFLTPLSADAFSGAGTSGLLGADHLYYAMGLEALLTFFLVNTILHVAVGGKGGPFGGWAIGTTIAIAILAGGPLTGASMNPARSFGPAVFTSAVSAGTLDYQNPMFYVIYFVGPFLGSLLAVGLYQFFTYQPIRIEDLEDVEEEEVEIVAEVVDEPVKKTAARKPAARKATPKKKTTKKA